MIFTNKKSVIWLQSSGKWIILLILIMKMTPSKTILVQFPWHKNKKSAVSISTLYHLSNIVFSVVLYSWFPGLLINKLLSLFMGWIVQKLSFGQFFSPWIWGIWESLTITCPCDLHPLTPHFYIVKLGFTGVYFFFLFLLQNIDCGYSLELPHWGGSNLYPPSMFWAKIRKTLKNFIWKRTFLQPWNIAVYCMGVFS